MFHLEVPVLIIAFNRPDLTQRVFDEVRKAQPPQLFFAANHPETPEDQVKSQQVRAILKQVDWDCEVRTLYPEKNTGHTWGPINAITWFFKHCPEGIVLEDDCVPNQSFFRFCQELLEYYRNDKRVFSIGGAVYLNPMPKLKYSYWFSPLTSTWGWASWRRSWEKVDFRMRQWLKLRDTNWLAKKIGSPYIARDYHKGIDKAYRTRDTKDFVGWDYIYNFTMLLYGGVDVRPAMNLVSNIGFRPDASHTKEKTIFADFPTSELEFPLKHPPAVKASLKLEEEFYRQTNPNFRKQTFLEKFFPLPLKKFTRKLAKIVRKIWRLPLPFSLPPGGGGKGEGGIYKFDLKDYLAYLFEEFGHRKIHIEELGDEDQLSRLRIQNFEFYWPKNQPRKELTALWQEVFNQPLLNPHSYDFPEGQIQAGWTVIDAGASEGFFTHFALSRKARVIAFEPVSVLAESLKRTFQNQKVTVVRALLGNTNQQSSIKVNSEMLSASSKGEGEECPMVTLDTWVKTNNLDKIDFIKMDIEGGELEAIPGAKEVIRRDKPKMAIAVYHDYENAKILKKILLSFRPDYQIKFRGIFDYGGVKPRPYMLYAY